MRVLTRREFLVAGAAVPFAARSWALGGGNAARWVFLGTDKGEGIYRARWDAATGEIGKIELAIAADRPNFFALHPTLPVMYSVNEMSGPPAGVSAFRVDAARGRLTLINRVSSHGDGPCAVSVDRTGKSAFVADYAGGSMAAFELAGDGALISHGNGFDCRHNVDCGVVGPVTDRQDAAHLHCVTVSPGNDFLLVCNLGEDAVEVFPIHPQKIASEILGPPMRVQARSGSGPRHVAFHPNGRWVYCIHELDCTIDLYDWRVREGKASMVLRDGSVISTLAKGVGLAGNSGCEILVSDDGRFVYACTRGVDEITVYRVDAASGLLTEQQRLSCGGQIPRYLALDPTRRWLVSCNQGAAVNPVGTVTVFAHDARTGRVGELPRTFAADTPMFVAWV